MNETGICDCGAINDVEWVIDPFQEEIYAELVWRWLCPDCYQLLCDEI